MCKGAAKKKKNSYIWVMLKIKNYLRELHSFAMFYDEFFACCFNSFAICSPYGKENEYRWRRRRVKKKVFPFN